MAYPIRDYEHKPLWVFSESEVWLFTGIMFLAGLILGLAASFWWRPF